VAAPRTFDAYRSRLAGDAESRRAGTSARAQRGAGADRRCARRRLRRPRHFLVIEANRRAVGRSIVLRLRRLPEPAPRLARALAILDESELLQAARLAGLEESDAAHAAELTASERRIAELASQHLTNREIAQILFITTRTVEGHLTSVFRKLRLDSRDELPVALAAGVPA
jgi:DNA-binding CsgD family transcriptional regulator